MPWFKGQIHCHSTNSDGELPPTYLALYYKRLGFNFLCVSDHNFLTLPDDPSRWGLDDNFIHIPACEYSGPKNCHVVGINISHTIKPDNPDKYEQMDKTQILQEGIDKTIQAGGLPIICHPFWWWTYGYEEIIKLKNHKHIEIWNRGSDCNSLPLIGYSPGDELWDRLLSDGFRFYALASDDAHVYCDLTKKGDFKKVSPGGRGYIVVKADTLTTENIIRNIESGHFYASIGVDIKEYVVTSDGIEISTEPYNAERFVFDFIGKSGKLLKREISDSSAKYTFEGNETYVRIRIGGTNSGYAWTQPVFLDQIDEHIRWTQS